MPHHCVLLIDANTDGNHGVDFENQNTPLMVLTSEKLHRKHEALSICSAILVLINNPGEWLNWLPVESRIIFITNDMDWIWSYPRLTRLKKSLYYNIYQEGDKSIHFDLYERKPFSNDLTKVPFVKVNRLLATKREGKVMSDFGGTELKAVAFNLSPFSVLRFDHPGGHDGYEINIVSTIARALNLNMVVKTPSSGGWWGSADKNGNFSGNSNEHSSYIMSLRYHQILMLHVLHYHTTVLYIVFFIDFFLNCSGLTGDLQHAVADIGWGNLFMTSFRMLIMDFTDWYLVDPTCFIYKRPKPYAGVFSLIFPLEKETWLFIFFMLVGVNLFYLLYSITWKDNTLTFSTLLLYETSVAFKVSHDMTYNLHTLTLR